MISSFWACSSTRQDQYQSRGETFGELQGPLVHTEFPCKQGKGAIGPYESPLKFIWANSSQISPKVLVYTSIGPSDVSSTRTASEEVRPS